jgi:hypothetical protein
MAVLTWPKPAQNATTLLDAVKFIKAANADPDLKQTDKTVLSILALKHYNFKTGRLDPSMGTIGKGAGIQRRAVLRAIKRLEELGYIGRESGRREGHRNRYRINWGVRSVERRGVRSVERTNLLSFNRRSASEKDSYRVSSGGADRDTEGDLVRLARPPARNADAADQPARTPERRQVVGVQPVARTADGGAT